MPNSELEHDDRERRLDEAAAKYFELHAAGQAGDRQQWLAQYPDLADELAEFLNDLDHVKSPVFSQSVAQVADPSDLFATTAYGSDSSSAQSDWKERIAAMQKRSTDRYRLHRLYARGGMGEIWFAEDTHVGRQIAVKKIRSSRDADAAMQERFLFEAQVMGQLEHPSIVPLHDLGMDANGEIFSVMKLVKGSSLKEKLSKFHAGKTTTDLGWPRQVEFARLLEAFVSICRAVAYAHSRGVLHRDIKPDNIMLGSYGEALLLDWGLAKLVDRPDFSSSTAGRSADRVSSGCSTHTQAGTILGSLAYMPPELATGDCDAIDDRTDVYLLGATLYEILSGRPPRDAKTRSELLHLAQSQQPNSPRLLDASIPRPLDAVCTRAMAFHRCERYPTAAALADEVEHYLAGEPVTAYRETAPMRVWRWCRRHRRSVQRTVLTLSFVLLVAGLWANFARARDLALREKARQQLAKFRQLADEAQYFAANLDPVTQHAPYFNPQLVLARGEEALSFATAWGTNFNDFPLPTEQARLRDELYGLLLILANTNLQKENQSVGTEQALHYLELASEVHPTTQYYHQLRSRCLKNIGRVNEASIESQLAQDNSSSTTALDYFLRGEFHRTAESSQVDQSPRTVGIVTEQLSLQAAIDDYQRAIQLDARHYWAHFQLARCYLSLGRGPEAVAALGTCVALRPDAPWAYSTRGLSQALLGEFEAAHVDFEKASSLDATFRPARLYRGYAFSLQYDYERALDELSAVLEPPASQSLIEAAFCRAQIYYQRGDYSAALRDCQRFLQDRPKTRPALWLESKICFRLNDDTKALQVMDRFLGIEVTSTAALDNPLARSKRGQALRKIAMDLDSLTSRRVLGMALDELQAAAAQGLPTGDEMTAVKDLLNLSTEVIEEYTRQLELAPNNMVIRKRRGWSFIDLQSYDRAAADFETVLQQSPADAEAHSGRGYLKALGKDFVAAEQETVQSMLLGANDYLVLHNVACIYAVMSIHDHAIEKAYEDLALTLLRRAVEIYRRNPRPNNEIELIRQESAFGVSLRARPEFQELIGESR